jgi:hypothetical protein
MVVVGILWIVPHWAWDLLAVLGSVFVFLDRRRLYQADSRPSAS